jgi:GNAT superfamily N-acetyltransferase
MEFSIREMTSEDAGAVNRLSAQLGYPLTVEQTKQNINAVMKSQDHNAFVAEYGNTIVGWIGAAHSIMIEVMPHCEINGLVIDEHYRGKGVGRILIAAVKQWAKEKGDNKLSLRCNITRADAHRFYEHLGFEKIKQQSNFVLNI